MKGSSIAMVFLFLLIVGNSVMALESPVTPASKAPDGITEVGLPSRGEASPESSVNLAKVTPGVLKWVRKAVKFKEDWRRDRELFDVCEIARTGNDLLLIIMSMREESSRKVALVYFSLSYIDELWISTIIRFARCYNPKILWSASVQDVHDSQTYGYRDVPVKNLLLLLAAHRTAQTKEDFQSLIEAATTGKVKEILNGISERVLGGLSSSPVSRFDLLHMDAQMGDLELEENSSQGNGAR